METFSLLASRLTRNNSYHICIHDDVDYKCHDYRRLQHTVCCCYESDFLESKLLQKTLDWYFNLHMWNHNRISK